MIEISQLSKSFDQLSVFENISIQIKKGDIFALLGESGAGKSTLLRCINGLVPYDQGHIDVSGIRVDDLSEEKLRQFRRNIGMIFQEFNLLERKTVYENVAFPLKCWKMEKEQVDSRVTSLLKLVGLSDKANTRPRELSGGQKQRVGIARALTQYPKVLLCDEATSALDPENTQSIMDLLVRLNKELDITIVLVSHQMEVVKSICNRMAYLEKGKITFYGEVLDYFKNSILLENNKDVLEKYYYKQTIKKLIEIEENPNEMQESFLSILAKRGDVSFNLLLSQSHLYRDENYNVYTINLLEKDWKMTKDLLIEYKLDWREL